jgi:glyceraldehyde 3-phosphate dehydrogenase
MAIKVAINGFGRIGRTVLRSAADDPAIDFVAINDITDASTLAHLLKYDSVHGKFKGDVTAGEGCIYVNGKQIRITAEKDPANLPWKDLQVEIVLEATGLFRDREKAGKHIAAGAKRVIISAPGKEPDVTLVLGVNDKDFDPSKHFIISNASCTTNCLAPVAKVLHDNYKIKRGWMTTIHAYTNDQKILDLPHKDLRRARAAAISMIPTTTGAAKAVGLVMPDLKGKLDGISIRVPTADVSVVDLVAEVEKQTTVEDILAKMKAAAAGPMKGYLEICEEELVSVDFTGNPASSILDAPSVKVIDGTLVKILSWYDNEWGYACRCRDLIKFLATKK